MAHKVTRQEALEMIQKCLTEHEIPSKWVECLELCARALQRVIKEDEKYKPSKPIVTCPICGKEFVKNNNARKFCSKECAQKAIYLERRGGPGTYQCAYCGKDFESDRKKKFCSDECRKASYLKTGKKRKKAESIEDVARLCRETGLTYGQLMTQRGYDI